MEGMLGTVVLALVGIWYFGGVINAIVAKSGKMAEREYQVFEREQAFRVAKGKEDLKSKIVIKDALGNITKMFDPDDGCDFCEGSGKDYKGDDCGFCGGKGEIGLTPCKKCNGERRILGKQKLNGVKLTGAETKIEAMGHHAKNEPGKVGYLLLIINNDIK